MTPSPFPNVQNAILGRWQRGCSFRICSLPGELSQEAANLLPSCHTLTIRDSGPTDHWLTILQPFLCVLRSGPEPCGDTEP